MKRTDVASVHSEFLWPDAQLRRIEIDYDDLRLFVEEAGGALKQVICEGYLGHELVGFWDEAIIERAALTNHGAFLDRCLSSIAHRHRGSPGETGSSARNRASAMQLVVTLGDGCQLSVAMKALRVEAANGGITNADD